MNLFKDLKVKPKETSAFIGEKIKISKLFNREIIVHDFKVQKSKFEKTEGQKCLYLQIELNKTKYVVFTGSQYLLDAIQQLDKSHFPFKTTIVEENERYEFT